VIILGVSGVLFWAWKKWNTLGPSTIYPSRFNYRGACFFFHFSFCIFGPITFSLVWEANNSWFFCFLCQFDATMTPGIVLMDIFFFLELRRRTVCHFIKEIEIQREESKCLFQTPKNTHKTKKRQTLQNLRFCKIRLDGLLSLL